MLKNITLAVVALLFVGATAKANDDLLDQVAGMDLSQITETVSEVDDFDLDGLDIDELAAEAGNDSDSDAIEACFRRMNRGYRGGSRGYSSYGHRSYGHRSYGHRSYSSCYRGYNSCYRTNYYSHNCYRPLYCCRPVTVNYCAPVCQTYTAPVCHTYTAPVCQPYCAPICTNYWGCH